MHTNTPGDWPIWIRLALPLITPWLRMIALLADARDRAREATLMQSIDEVSYVDLRPSASGRAEISPEYVDAEACPSTGGSTPLSLASRGQLERSH